MVINSVSKKTRFLQSRFLKKNLEFAAQNGALYSAGTTLVFSSVVRPIAIFLSPNAQERDKQYASAKSIASALVGLGMTALISTPIVNAVNKIKDKPLKFLSKKSASFYKSNSQRFKFAQESAKLSSNFLCAYPKTFFTAALIPPVIDFIFRKPKKEEEKVNSMKFGKSPDLLSKWLGKIYDSKTFRKIADKYAETNLAQHLFCANDILLTHLFIRQTMKSPKIEQDRKKPLAINAGLMTGFTIAGCYILDKITKKPMEKFIEDFKQANKNDPKLGKYLDGFKIVKPVVILAGLYYIIAPIFATMLADKLSRNENEKRN